jgi:hypothetical protein
VSLCVLMGGQVRHLAVAGRADPEGPRGRPDGERARSDRHWRQRGGQAGDPGIEVTSSEDGAGWLAFLRGLSGVQLVTSDCHQGLRDAVASVLPRRVLAALQNALRRPRGYADLVAGVPGGGLMGGGKVSIIRGLQGMRGAGRGLVASWPDVWRGGSGECFLLELYVGAPPHPGARQFRVPH